MTVKTTRRAFLKQVAVAGALGPVILSGRAGAAARGKVRHASIGVGGMGSGDLAQISSHPDVEIVALCDVDRQRLEEAGKKHPGAALYQDWRRLLEKEGGRIDSVNVTTPDHMHAPITMTALRMGKHVFSQKPLCHDIHEAHEVASEAARRPDQATQMGIQIHSHTAYRTAVAMIQFGLIGRVKEVHSWSGKAWTGKKGESETRPDHTDPVRTTSTGTSGSARRPSARSSMASITRGTGGGGSISAPAPRATWPATSSTPSSRPWN